MFKLETTPQKAVITAYGYIGGYINFRAVADAIEDIRVKGLKAVDVKLHTEGGSVIDGNLIYNLFSSFKGEIDFYIDGIAASMGSVLIMSGARVHIAENGFIMIHRPSAGVNGNVDELINTAKLVRSMETTYAQRLADKMRKPLAEIKSTYFDGADHWIDADEAIQLGLAVDKYKSVNGVTTFTKDYAAQVGAKSLYSAYTALAVEDKPKPENMKTINLKLKLKEDASEPEAVTAIEAIEARATAAELKLKEFQDKEKAALKAEATALINTAKDEQRIDAASVPAWETAFEKDPVQAKAMLAGIPKRATAKEVVEGGAAGAAATAALEKLTWDEADKAGKLAEIKAKHPEMYIAKFEAEFGKKPKL